MQSDNSKEKDETITLELKIRLTREKRHRLTEKLSEALEIPVNWENIKLLIFKGADLDAQNPHTDDTALMLASAQGKEGLVKFLIRNNASINFRNKSRETALSKAIFSGNLEIVEKLVSHGADIFAVISDKTLLELAIQLNQCEIAKILEQYYDACGAEKTYKKEIN